MNAITKIAQDAERKLQYGAAEVYGRMEHNVSIIESVCVEAIAAAEHKSRNGNWLDEMGACKVCGGEIPYGHTENCDIWKLERKAQPKGEPWMTVLRTNTCELVMGFGHIKYQFPYHRHREIEAITDAHNASIGADRKEGDATCETQDTHRLPMKSGNPASKVQSSDAGQASEQDAEQLAQRFHETYERLAPAFNYETRKASAKPWAEVPDNNKKLMIAVCAEILSHRPTPATEGKP